MKDEGPNRRAVLGAAALATGALATAALPSPAAAEPAAEGGWNLGWATRVGRAKHRIVFDSPEIDHGMALMNALLYMRDYHTIYKAADADLGVVVVVRHMALPMVLGDDMWARMKLGAFAKLTDPETGTDAMRNPFIHVKPGDKTLLYDPGAAMDALIARGVTVLCCNMALLRFAGMLAKADNLSGEDAHKTLIASLVPAVIPMPSGIFAAARAQEAGCHYIRST